MAILQPAGEYGDCMQWIVTVCDSKPLGVEAILEDRLALTFIAKVALAVERALRVDT